MHYAILLGSFSLSYSSPDVQRPYVRLKIPQFLANIPLTSASRGSQLLVFPLPFIWRQNMAQNILFLELNALLFCFSKAWAHVLLFSVLSDDSAPPSCSYRWCGLFMLCTHTRLHQHKHCCVFVSKGEFFAKEWKRSCLDVNVKKCSRVDWQ